MALAAVTGFTYRHDWGNWRGQPVLHLTSPTLLRAGQKFFVAIGEGVAPGPSAGKFIGAARYTAWRHEAGA